MSNSYKSEIPKPILVLGLGNLLMRDEGIGVHVIRAFATEQKRYPHVEFADGGTAGMGVLHAIANRRKAVIVDCARMSGVVPGGWCRFTPKDVHSVKQMPGFSLHEGDFLSVIKISEQLGECPDEVIIFGIEPDEVSPGENLSATLAGKLNEYMNAIRRELSVNI